MAKSKSQLMNMLNIKYNFDNTVDSTKNNKSNSRAERRKKDKASKKL